MYHLDVKKINKSIDEVRNFKPHIVMMFGVICHLRYPDYSLNEILEIVADNGVFVLNFPKDYGNEGYRRIERNAPEKLMSQIRNEKKLSMLFMSEFFAESYLMICKNNNYSFILHRFDVSPFGCFSKIIINKFGFENYYVIAQFVMTDILDGFLKKEYLNDMGEALILGVACRYDWNFEYHLNVFREHLEFQEDEIKSSFQNKLDKLEEIVRLKKESETMHLLLEKFANNNKLCL